MNERSFLCNVLDSKKLLEDWGVLKTSSLNIYKSSSEKFSDSFLNQSKKNDYFSLYKCAIENDDYDFLLKDNSFFQFAYDNITEKKCEVIRLAFYQAAEVCSYEDFLVNELDEDIEKCGSEYLALYQQYISEQEPPIIYMLRYDYDRSLYKNQIHSAAHIHFGDAENIRVPINTQLKPSGFVKLVLEYFYYKDWETLVNTGDKSIWITEHDTEILDKAMFDEDDQLLPYLFVHNRKK